MADLTTFRGREKLKPRPQPYWQQLASRQFLGFRPSTVGRGGTWIARHYDPETRGKPIRSLGDFGHLLRASALLEIKPLDAVQGCSWSGPAV